MFSTRAYLRFGFKGVTPFASILKTIRYRIEAALHDGGAGSRYGLLCLLFGLVSWLRVCDSDGRLRQVAPVTVTKVYFYHIVREKNAFEWFFELLVALENENINDFLEIHTYLTSVKGPEEARRLVDDEGIIKSFYSGFVEELSRDLPNIRQPSLERQRSYHGTADSSALRPTRL